MKSLLESLLSLGCPLVGSPEIAGLWEADRGRASGVGGMQMMQMIELTEVIVELRRELEKARATADPDEKLRFELGPVELEATVGGGEERWCRRQGSFLGRRAGR